jgi:Skp family chaperone for outer membrane proteins
MMKEIFGEMDVVIKKYARENNYDLIFDERVLIYASDSIDITADITRLLNQKR